MTTAYKVIGTSQGRVEGASKVTGAAKYAADYTPPGTLYVKVVRSPFPHALIKSIDVSKALALSGVKGVLTAKDFPGARVGQSYRDMPVLAEGKVRFIGEKVAAVCAETEEIADEALALIEVNYEEIPAVFDPILAMKADAPIIHENFQKYIGFRADPPKGQTNTFISTALSQGDIEKGFKEADRIFEQTFTTHWAHSGYIEPTACVADATGPKVKVWISTKVPFSIRKQLSEAVNIKPEDILINIVHCGGDFGGKRQCMDSPLCYAFSKMTGRPAKMVMDYSEELLAGNARHPSVIRFKTGVKKDGTITAIDAEVVYNTGAYGSFAGGMMRGAEEMLVNYKCANTRLRAFKVYTNNTPSGIIRAPGAPQAFFASESNADMIARGLGMDPLEFRRKNSVKSGDMTAIGHHAHDVHALECLETAVKVGSYGKPKAKGVGMGIALGIQNVRGSETHTFITMNTDGTVAVRNSKPDTGVGTLTVGQMITAEELGVPIKSVRASMMNTDEVINDSGMGGSTGTKGVGMATLFAANDFKENIKKAATQTLNWDAADIEVNKGTITNKKTKESMSFPDFVKRHGASVSGEGHNKPEQTDTTANACQVAEVHVDEETGRVTLLSLTTVNDAGQVINALGFEGQVEGGAMQGIGYAMMEDWKIEDGRPITTTLGDYKMPTITDIPVLHSTALEYPAKDGPYGAKNIGENVNFLVAPAIANAIDDAVGVRITELPITAEKVYRALKASKKR